MNWLVTIYVLIAWCLTEWIGERLVLDARAPKPNVSRLSIEVVTTISLLAWPVFLTIAFMRSRRR